MIQTDLRMDTLLLMAAFFVAIFLFAGAPRASVRNGGSFEPRFATADRNLERLGTGLIRCLGIFTVSEAGLCLPAGTEPGHALSGDTPRRLEVRYFHDLKKVDFAESTRVWIRKNITEAEYRALEPRIERFNALCEDAKEGDRYGLTYRPGVGTALDLNGETKGIVPGADFAEALFSIWLGDEPVEDGLPGALLRRT